MIGYNKSEIVGKMRERVILQNRIITQSDSGFQSEIYNDIGIYWSKIEYKTGFEEEDADKITNQQKINITLRYNILVNVNSRFVYRNELYQVEKVEYSDDRRFMTCVCVWRSSYTSIYAGSIFCSASLLAQSSLSAALMRVIKYQASLNAFGSVSADIALVQKVASSLNAFGTLTGDITFVKNMQAALNGTAALSGGITFVQKPEASLNAFGTLVSDLKIAKTFESSLNANGTLVSNATIAKNLASSLTSSNSLAANALVSKLASASLTGVGTTTANLTVTAPSAGLLLDLYPTAAVAYSLRKLRTAYTGNAIRVRASTSGAEGDVSFDVNSTISASSIVTVTAVGTSGLSIGQEVTFSTFWNAGGSNQNVFVTTWYDQSGNANNATQTTQANQPQIVSSGVIILAGSKPSIVFDGTNDSLSLATTIANVNINSSHYQSFVGERGAAGRIMLFLSSSITGSDYVLTHWSDNKFYFYANPTQIFASSSANTALSLSLITGQNNANTVSVFINSTSIPGSNTNDAFTRKINAIGRYFGSLTNSKLSESVFYLSNQSTNRIGIETNINTHYGIY